MRYSVLEEGRYAGHPAAGFVNAFYQGIRGDLFEVLNPVSITFNLDFSIIPDTNNCFAHAAAASYPVGSRVALTAPISLPEGRDLMQQVEIYSQEGYSRLVDRNGNFVNFSELQSMPRTKLKTADYELLIDRLATADGGDELSRLAESAETAFFEGHDSCVLYVWREDGGIDRHEFSRRFEADGISFMEPSEQMFNFNNPFGACPSCTGLGSQMKLDPELIIPNRDLSIVEGGITASGWNNIKSDGISRMYFDALAKKYKFKLNTPIKDLPPEVLDVILHGTNGEKLTLHYDQPRGKGTLYQPFEGIVNNLERRYRETQSDAMKRELEECMSQCPCPACQGRRLKKETLAVTVGGLDIDSYCRKSVTEALDFVEKLVLNETQTMIAAQILKEIKNRLGFLQSVGLQYLTLSREAGTLSGGESQRIRLATQIGSSLMGVLYILDEPSIGLHQRDNDKLLQTLKELRDLGNTLLVVEHDEDTMREADYIIDVGPGAG